MTLEEMSAANRLSARGRTAGGSGIRFRVLGTIDAEGPDGPIALGGPKQRTVFALLVMKANTVVPAESLIDDVWGDEPPDAARNTLQSYISRLRAALGPERVHTRSRGYLLELAPDELDAARFETLLAAAREAAGHPDRVTSILRDALSLWRGPAFADLSSEPALAGDIVRLEDLRMNALEERIGADLELGLHVEVIGELEALVRREPLRERLRALQMTALYRAGRQGDALASYQELREVLAEELGVDPSAELQRLHERMLRQDEGLEVRGHPLRGYQLLEQIGEGAFGVVYRAIQPQVGRDVAVKAIHPELANQPDFVRRFEREAQLVARIEHPHVVPLYDYWRDPDGAYLVMRYLRGGSVEDLLEAGPLELGRTVEIVGHIASALSAAHRQGVVHRDVKPGNLLLDEDGNAYLSDFGVALDAGAPEHTSGMMIRGTPAYLSPEQIRLEPTTARSDIYALGVVVYRMLTGEHPFPDGSLQALLDRHLSDPLPSVTASGRDLPPGVDAVIARATAKSADERFDDALDMAEALASTIRGEAVAVAPTGPMRNPYKGLRAFLEPDATDFFGRDTVIRRLVERMAEPTADARFLCVVGPSGSGKSSVVRAGVLPALRRGAIAGSDRWFVIDLHPGTNPLRELEAALLSVAVDPPPSLLEDLERGASGLADAVDRVLPDRASELLVVIDQFEEVFTLADERERTHLLDAIVDGTRRTGSRVRFVATLRADFYDLPLSVRDFGGLLASRTEAITPMSAEQLERAIVGPAEHVGLRVDPGLVAAMVGDVLDRPGALPLLQYALTELGERGDHVLRVEAYRELGGVTGALARRAEELFTAMDEDGREACRQLFLRLISLEHGSEETRRRVRRSELPQLGAAPMDAAIAAFGRHRLLSFDRDPVTREPTIEIAHESLLGAWSRLRSWIDAARGDLSIRHVLDASTTEWVRGDRDPSFLLRGARLETTEAWAAGTTVALSDEDRAFLLASVERRDGELAAERQRRERERLLERRGIRRLRSLVALGIVATLVASTLTVTAIRQRARAQREARVATARELASAAEASLDVDPERSILLALSAIDEMRPDGTTLPEAVQALHDGLGADRLLLTLDDPSTANVAYSPDGRLLATGGTAGGKEQDDVVIWDATTGRALDRLIGHSGDISYVAFSPDSTRVVTTAGAPDARTIVWDVATGEQLFVVPGVRSTDLNQGATFSPDGTRIAIAELQINPNTREPDGGTVRIVDAATGHEVGRVEATAACWAPIYSADGSELAVPGSTSGSIGIFDPTTLEEITSIPEQACNAVFSPDGERIAAGNDRLNIWDLPTGRTVASTPTPEGILGLDWSADGRLIASGEQDGTARIWDATSGSQLDVLEGHTALVALVAFSPDGTRLVTGGGDGTARVWDITPAGTAERFGVSEPTGLSNVAFIDDGTGLLTSGWGGTGSLWDLATRTREGAIDDVEWTAPGADGEIVAIAKHVRLLDARGTTVRTFDSDPWSTLTAAISADGAFVAAADTHGHATIWDAATGDEVHVLGAPIGPLDSMNDVAFSPDGTYLAGVSGLATLYLWDVATGRQLLRFQAASGLGASVAFSPDGSMIASAGADGATIWSVPSGRRVATMSGVGRVEDVTFDADGSRIATAGDDGVARIWDVASGRELLTLGASDDILTAVAFSPDGSALATSSADGTIHVFELRIPALVALARARVTRGLTADECTRYLHRSPCPRTVPPARAQPPVPTASGPEGAFAATIDANAFGTAVSPRDARADSGPYTLSLFAGRWRLQAEGPDAFVVWSGTYTANGAAITFTADQGDPACYGGRWSAEWSIDGSDLSFTATTSDAADACPAAAQAAWVDAVFGASSWLRVGAN